MLSRLELKIMNFIMESKQIYFPERSGEYFGGRKKRKIGNKFGTAPKVDGFWEYLITFYELQIYYIYVFLMEVNHKWMGECRGWALMTKCKAFTRDNDDDIKASESLLNY